MTIYLNAEAPAFAILKNEQIDVRPEEEANPEKGLRILLVNQMGKESKTATDVQWSRLLAGTSAQVHLTLAVPDGYVSKDGSPAPAHYFPFSAIKNNGYKGLLVTGAPYEGIPYSQITTWPSLREIFLWADRTVTSSIFVCWAAQAELLCRYGIKSRSSEKKFFGVHSQKLWRPAWDEFGLEDRSKFAGDLLHDLNGKSDEFSHHPHPKHSVPVSRYTYFTKSDIWNKRDLEVIFDSRETHQPYFGHEEIHLGLVCSRVGTRIYSFNHPEYDWDTLGKEYLRDIAAGKDTEPPRHYETTSLKGGTKILSHEDPWLKTREENPAPPPWRKTAQVIVDNWVRYVNRWQNDFQI